MRVLTPLLLLALATVSCASTESDTPTPDLGSPDPAPAGRSPAATSGTVASSEPSVTPAAGTYLALGDSLAVGVGASQPERGGYVARVHQALESRALSNLAVSGETSGSFLDGGQMSAALQVIEEAQPPVSVVTLDIGGNDLLRLLGSDPCASGPDSAACRRTVAVTLAAFEGNYRAALGALRDALDASAPGAAFAVMTYFNPFSGTDAVYELGGELALLGRDRQVACRAADRDPTNRGMNDIIACVARELDVLVADVHPRFRGLGLALTHIGNEDIHANDRGYEVIAEELVSVLTGQ